MNGLDKPVKIDSTKNIGLHEKYRFLWEITWMTNLWHIDGSIEPP